MLFWWQEHCTRLRHPLSRAGLGRNIRSRFEGLSGIHHPECLNFRVIPVLPLLACLASHFSFHPVSITGTQVLSLVWPLILGLCVPSSLQVTRGSREEILAWPGWPSFLPALPPQFSSNLVSWGRVGHKSRISPLCSLSPPLSQFPPGLKEAKENRELLQLSLSGSPSLPAPGRWFTPSPALAEPGLGVEFL